MSSLRLCLETENSAKLDLTIINSDANGLIGTDDKTKIFSVHVAFSQAGHADRLQGKLIIYLLSVVCNTSKKGKNYLHKGKNLIYKRKTGDCIQGVCVCCVSKSKIEPLIYTATVYLVWAFRSCHAQLMSETKKTR